jgi:hypothetical protein
MKMELTAWLALTVLAGGCVTTVPDYDVSMKNVGSTRIDAAHVVYGEFRSAGGILIAGGIAGHGHVPYPIPDTATVEWRTADRTLYRKDVDLTSIPKDFSGEIRFEIDDGNYVTIHTIPRKK